LCAGLEAGIEGSIHSVTERAEEHNSLEFGEWEVNDEVWEKDAEEGEMQVSLPERRAREVMAAWMQALDEQVEELGEGEELLPELVVALEGILLLIDATNGFNMLICMGMLGTVRHRCPKMATFAIKGYRHEVHLVCRRPGKETLILLSREGVTQEDPMAMSMYGIALCPLTEHLRAKFLDVLQPWYADNAAMMASADK
ncbi:hypothetical protein ACHAWF_000465, partial [Thalassiosira exigua]